MVIGKAVVLDAELALFDRRRALQSWQVSLAVVSRDSREVSWRRTLHVSLADVRGDGVLAGHKVEVAAISQIDNLRTRRRR